MEVDHEFERGVISRNLAEPVVSWLGGEVFNR